MGVQGWGTWVWRDPRKHQALAQGMDPSDSQAAAGALSIPAQAWLALVMGGKVPGAWAVGCSWVLLVPPKNTEQKGNTPHRQQEMGKGDLP